MKFNKFTKLHNSHNCNNPCSRSQNKVVDFFQEIDIPVSNNDIKLCQKLGKSKYSTFREQKIWKIYTL